MNKFRLKICGILLSIATLSPFLVVQRASAQNINLRQGEFITLTCGNNAVNPANPGGDPSCARENADLRVRLNQAHNDLLNCQSSKPISCTFKCGDKETGFGSGPNKAEACRAARDNSSMRGCNKEECECARD